MKLLIVLLGVVSLLPVSAVAETKTRTLSTQHHARGTVSALADSEDDIDSFSKIRADVRITDDGVSDTVVGTGSGFDAALTYVSFFYGTGSVPRGSLACLPPTPNNLTPAQMFVGYWLPVGSTRRTLQAVKTALSTYPYAPLTAIGTMSVRYDSTPAAGGPLVNLGPGRYFLNSCGRLRQ